MKCLRFLPLAFVAGIDGFHLFAPYAALVLLVVLLVARLRQRRENSGVFAQEGIAHPDLVPAFGN